MQVRDLMNLSLVWTQMIWMSRSAPLLAMGRCLTGSGSSKSRQRRSGEMGGFELVDGAETESVMVSACRTEKVILTV